MAPMTDYSLWLRTFWQIHRVMDRLSGGRTGRRIHSIRARETTAEERERLWPRLVQLFPDYAKYRQRTSRLSPVVILEPRTAG